MPYFMIQASYTPEAWAAMVKNPQNRAEAVRPIIEGMGGKIESAYLAFGEHDAVVICQMPDHVNAAAFAMAVAAGRGVRSIKTTLLLSKAAGLEAMKRAGGLAYKAPM